MKDRKEGSMEVRKERKEYWRLRRKKRTKT